MNPPPVVTLDTTPRKPYASDAYIAWLNACAAKERASGLAPLEALLAVMMDEGFLLEVWARLHTQTVGLYDRARPGYMRYDPQSPSRFSDPDDRPPGGRFASLVTDTDANSDVIFTNDPWYWEALTYPERPR